MDMNFLFFELVFGTNIWMEEEDELLDLPPKPEEPGKYDCCGRGCERCVYDIYYEALDKWENLREKLREKRKGN